MKLKHNYIKRCFTDLDDLKSKGVFFSGVKDEGEYKGWYSDGQLFTHCFYKDGDLDGEKKIWQIVGGKLEFYKLYRKGKVIKDYLK